MPVSVVHSPIEVNLNVLIDASGNLEVFNSTKPVVTNMIVAEHALPVTALYNEVNTTGLLELWEPSDAQGDIKVQLANTNQTAEGGLDFTGAYQTYSKALASGLETILCDKFDCSGASPFLNYTSNVEYYKQRDFGRVALATYAHYMFGHVDATAAITNDKAFVQGMLSINAAGDDESAEGAAARAAAWTKSTTANVQAWDNASSGVDANLALRLVKAIVGKGLDVAGAPTTSLVSTNNSASLANIVAQVVGQDASRLMNVDSSQRTRDQHIALRFYAGDVIYMNIKLKTPIVSVGTKAQSVSGATLESMYLEENFTMKITLANPPLANTNFTYLDAEKTIISGYNGAVSGAIVIPEGVTVIATNAFRDMNGITTVSLPSTITAIGVAAFKNCTGMTSINLLNSITFIGAEAFMNCTSLAAVNIPTGINEIRYNTFSSCNALTSVTIPGNVSSVGADAFLGCTELASVIIQNGVVTLEDGSFMNTPKLVTVTIPGSVVVISPSAFSGSAFSYP